jgi:acetaldehyde dehydrogenase/alcohol dehydrogenase
MANDFTDGLCLKAIQLVFKYLPRAVKDGRNDLEAREKMHNAATIAGMAFANAFLGMTHSLAHKVGAAFHTVHGYTCAVFLPHVIRYNGSVPTKLSVWPKYNHYCADVRYQEIAQLLGLKADTPQQGVESLAQAVLDLTRECGLDPNLEAMGISEQQLEEQIDSIAVQAYEDQCSPANPRVPMVEDMKAMIRKAYRGN